jgi:hypothetical protein
MPGIITVMGTNDPACRQKKKTATGGGVPVAVKLGSWNTPGGLRKVKPVSAAHTYYSVD